MILVLSIGLVILCNLLTAYTFESIAQMKGHSGFFWLCLLFGPAGWAMVIALPDRKAVPPELLAALKQQSTDSTTTVSHPATDNDLPDL